ncbi:MAG: hypothetical protein ACR2QW_08200, partial [bacterium]
MQSHSQRQLEILRLMGVDVWRVRSGISSAQDHPPGSLVAGKFESPPTGSSDRIHTAGGARDAVPQEEVVTTA